MQIKTAIDGSLKRLQTDYVDIYQLHWPERNVNKFGQLGYEHDENEKWQDNLLEVMQQLNELIRQGKIRHWGVSNETPWGLMKFIGIAEINGLPKPVTIQNPYSLLNRTYEIGMAEISMREQIGLLAYSPMAYGLLSGKFHDGSDVSKSRIRLFPKLGRYSSELSFEIAEKYVHIAKKYGLKPAQMALAYVNTRPFLWSTIIGATTMEQLRENIGSVEVRIPPECENEIEKLHLSNSNPAP
jgi:aryl-alcohol dehydrogenase-like predicted oxidoreductase